MIIALGHKKRRGKDTVAMFLEKYHNFKRVSFAGNLKSGVACFFGWDDDNERNKEDIDSYWGVSRRDAWREFGQFARKRFGADFWVKSMMRSHGTHGNIVISDMRMVEGEAEWVKACGGYTVRVDRPQIDKDDGHITEVSLDSYDYDYVINNDGTMYDLMVKTDKMLEDLKCKELNKKSDK